MDPLTVAVGATIYFTIGTVLGIRGSRRARKRRIEQEFLDAIRKGGERAERDIDDVTDEFLEDVESVFREGDRNRRYR